MRILRDLPQQKNPRVLCRGSSPNFICSHVPMEIFLFYEIGKKWGNEKRVVYLRGGTCPSRWTLKCGGLPSQGPSSNHRGAAFTTAWIMSLNVGLGSTPSLTDSQSCIGVNK
jgi:hypothetical protein